MMCCEFLFLVLIWLLWCWGWAGKDFSEGTGYSRSAILDFQVEFVAETAVNASILQCCSKTRVKIVGKEVSLQTSFSSPTHWSLPPVRK